MQERCVCVLDFKIISLHSTISYSFIIVHMFQVLWLGVLDTNDNDNANVDGVSWLESSFINQVGPKLASLGLGHAWAKGLVEIPSHTTEPIRHDDDPRLEEIFKFTESELRRNPETLMAFHNAVIKRKNELKAEADKTAKKKAEQEEKRNADLVEAKRELERLQKKEEVQQSVRKRPLREKKAPQV